MRILAIDPGYDRLGVAVLKKGKTGGEELIYSECFSPDKKLEENQRIFLVGQKIKDLIKKYNPEALALENLFFNTNQKTALLVSQVRGVIIYEALSAKILVKQFTPLQIKIAVTGYGRSDKRQVSEMLKKLIKIENTNSLGDDECDAIAVGLTFFAVSKNQIS